MKPEPLISIIIPTYNRAGILKDAIESALKQTYVNKEVIVVDDGSTDHTAELVSSFKNITYIFQNNSGQASARNRGLEIAKGEFIASLDSDDQWDENFISFCVEKLENDQLDFVFTNWYQQDGRGNWKNFFENFPYLTGLVGNNTENWVTFSYPDLRNLYLRSCPSPSSSLVIRRSSMVTGWNEKMTIGDDWCLLIDLVLSKECKAALSMQQLWYKRIDGKNIYNGRNQVEMMKLLNLKDIGVLMERYAAQLSKAELRIFQERYFETLYVLSKYFAYREPNIRELKHLAKLAFQIHPLVSLERLTDVLLRDCERIIKGFLRKRSKNDRVLAASPDQKII